MPILNNARHEKFAQLVATGQSAMSAYAKVYKTKGKSAANAASRLMENASIQERIREIQGKAAAVAVLTIERKRELLLEIAERRKPSKVVDAPTGCVETYDVIKAIELDAKLAGELTERAEVTVDDKRATVVELAERIKNVSPLLQGMMKKEKPPASIEP